MTTHRWMLHTAAMLLGAALTLPALAQDEGDPDYIPDDVTEEEEKKTGWQPMLSLSANLALAGTKNVVGTEDGLTMNGGLLINAGLTYLSDNGVHEWSNQLNWGLGYTRTPAIPKFAKSLDNLDFKTSYLLHPIPAPWVGPFVSFNLKSSVFKGYALSGSDTTVVRLDLDGVEESRETIEAAEAIALTKAFSPTQMRESIGAYAIPVNKPVLRMDFRLGIGAWETFVAEGYTVSDNEDTDELELQALQDSVQLGAEFGFVATGTIKEHFTWTGRMALMQPFVHNAETELTGLQLLNTEAEALLGFKITRWLSVDYQIKAYRYPLVIDAWQVQNGLLLSFTANVIGG